MDHDAKVEQFIKNVVPSFLAWDILHFLYTNPQACDSVEGLAKNIGRDVEQVKKEVEVLSARGFIESKSVDNFPVYSLTSNPEKIKEIQEFMTYCQDPSNRLRVVYALLNK